MLVGASSLGETMNFGAEYWISRSLASLANAGTAVSELVDLHNEGTMEFGTDGVFLDTSAANNGFLQLQSSGSTKKSRVSHKKIARPGDIIISRLRPYLHQVALIPGKFLEITGLKEAYCSTEFYVLRPKIENASIIPLWLLSAPIQNILEQAAAGGHHPRFDSGLLLDLKVPDVVLQSSEMLGAKYELLAEEYLACQMQLRKMKKAVTESILEHSDRQTS